MAIKTVDEIMSSVKTIIGESTDDNTLTFIEDVKDTLTSLSKSDTEDWKAKYEENDKQWREKYRERFFSGKDDDIAKLDKDLDPEPKSLKYEDLFK